MSAGHASDAEASAGPRRGGGEAAGVPPAILLAMLLASALALALRLWRLEDLGLWHDEALAWQRAIGPMADLLRGRAIDQDPPLMALLLRAWIGLGGDDAAWLRLPGVLAGAATAGLAGYWLGRGRGWRAGAMLALLFALSPAQVHYARELNQYAFLPLLTILLLLGHERLLRGGGARDWTCYGLLSTIALATHYGMVFPLAFLGLDLVLRGWGFGRVRRCGRHGEEAHDGGASGQPDRVPRGDGTGCAGDDGHGLPAGPGPARARYLRRYLLATGLFVALLAWMGLAERAMLPHLDARLFGTSLAKEFDYLADRLWRELLVFHLLPFSGGAALWTVSALAMLSLWGLEERGSASVGALPFGVIGLLVGPLLLGYPADILGMYPLGNRWSLFLAPALLAALALGLDRLWRESRALGLAGGLATSTIFLAFLPQMDAQNPLLALPREGTRAVVAALDAHAKAGDRVFVWHALEPAFDYYAARVDSRGGWRVTAGAHPDEEAIEAQLGRLLRESDETAETNEGAAPAEIWLVLGRIHPEERNALEGALAARAWRIDERASVEGATLARLVR